nr:unnamed protein product [Digitaria exilis]
MHAAYKPRNACGAHADPPDPYGTVARKALTPIPFSSEPERGARMRLMGLDRSISSVSNVEELSGANPSSSERRTDGAPMGTSAANIGEAPTGAARGDEAAHREERETRRGAPAAGSRFGLIQPDQVALHAHRPHLTWLRAHTTPYSPLTSPVHLNLRALSLRSPFLSRRWILGSGGLELDRRLQPPLLLSARTQPHGAYAGELRLGGEVGVACHRGAPRLLRLRQAIDLGLHACGVVACLVASTVRPGMSPAQARLTATEDRPSIRSLEVSRDATPHDPRERSAPTRCCNQEEAGRPKP